MAKWTIYCHTHVASGRRYIGLTKMGMMKRWNRHVYSANRGLGKGFSHFANAIRKYGKNAFSHEVLEVCDSLESANAAEERWIKHFDTRDPDKGFNLLPGGSHAPHPTANPWDRPEYREKASAASKKKWEDPGFRAAVTAGVTEAWRNPVHRERMSESSREVNSRPEVKAAIVASLKEREFSDATRAKISANRSGRSLLPEVRAKISKSSKSGTEEAREMASRSSKKRWEDPVFRAKMASLNRSSDPEVRKKISDSLKARKSALSCP